ncbi:acyltransferase family protein [Rothia terrae]|uniref:Acyltransferase n=1 Tax=Rothia terrae TaxID=396015 RepID=A0A7H2BCT2_9MICC|nr:acyltransferase family protein [Rothia terrae]QNV37478.1 acyltransferase [Rothia terrae]
MSTAEKTRRRKPLGTYLETRGFRPEVQGLRALAVLLVVMYHVWFGKVSGGVDVFLLVSAFLLSLSNLRKINEHKPLNLIKYWLHVFQRLMPTAGVVLLLTLLASYFIMPASRFAAMVADAKASLLYYQNWHLAFSAVDYYQQNATLKTPFQHFWSLSMQGQIFFLWPILFAIVALLVRKFRFNLMGSALMVFGTVFVASLTWSVISTQTQQAFAYFDTRARLWEFAAGTLIAMGSMLWKAPRVLRIVMGWVGVVGLVSAGMVLPVETGFPGYLALWPIVSGALVMLAGNTESRFGVDRILMSRPLLWVGESAYALYLVHWPLLILYMVFTNKPHAGVVDGALIIGVAVGLAWVLHRFVEQPLRGGKTTRAQKKDTTAPWAAKPASSWRTNNPWIRPIITVIACLALIGGPIAVAQNWVTDRDSRMEQLAETGAGTDEFPGAAAIQNGEPALYAYPPIPASNPQSQFDGLTQQCSDASSMPSGLEKYCAEDSWGSEDEPLTVVVGDSHAEQALASYRPIAEDNQSNMRAFLLGGCHFTVVLDSPEQDCNTFRKQAMQEILRERPDNVLMLVTAAQPGSNQEVLIPGIEETVQKLTDAGINVIALRDNPRYTEDLYNCAQLHANDTGVCSAPVSEKLAATNPAQELIDSNPGVFGVDLTEYYCPDGVCTPLIGNIYVYIDHNHISKSYAKTVSPMMRQQLNAQGLGV